MPAHRAVLGGRVAEHQPPPRAVHHPSVDPPAGDQRRGQLAAVGQHVRQRPHRREHRRSLGAGPELDHVRSISEPRHGRVRAGARAQFVRVLRVGWRDGLAHQRQRGAQLGARDDRLDRLPPCDTRGSSPGRPTDRSRTAPPPRPPAGLTPWLAGDAGGRSPCLTPAAPGPAARPTSAGPAVPARHRCWRPPGAGP